jgi:hypothetical protein
LKPWLASAGAVAAGFFVTAVASTAADAVHAAGISPSSPRSMSELVAGLAGVVAYYRIGGAELGPSSYAISIPVEAIPCVWLGGRLAASRRSSAGASA